MFVVIEHRSRRLIDFNVTGHPAAQWTRQQLREAVGVEERYAYLLHDGDAIIPVELDESIQRQRPPRSSKPNAVCGQAGGISGGGLGREIEFHDHPLAHDELLDLARDCHREFLDEAHVSRHFVVRDLVLAEFLDFLFARLRARA